jgi:uncharacterized protein (DUF488 family)
MVISKRVMSYTKKDSFYIDSIGWNLSFGAYTKANDLHNSTKGKKLPEFIEKIEGLNTVIDVRRSAISYRVPDFSKKSLSIELPAIGIQYIHRPEFGAPKDVVDSYTNHRTISDEEFDIFYRNNHSVDTLEIEDKTVLLCACAYAVKTPGKQKYNCHRSILANMLLEAGKTEGVIHL